MKWDPILTLAREGMAPLAPDPAAADRDALRLAFVIPPFTRGSGGHNSIFQIITRLEARGHEVSVWVEDPYGWVKGTPAETLLEIQTHFAPIRGPVHHGFAGWAGADVVVATGWQTVYPAARLEGCAGRAYFVQDHEPDFYPVSAERLWAEQTYRMGFHAICGSRWLTDLVHDRYGAASSTIEFGVDRDVYFPDGRPRREDTVIFFARSITPRRAVPIGRLALMELHRRRPGVRIVTFGEKRRPLLPFPVEHMGVASPAQLADAYREATVGMCLSLSNYSLVPQEMLAAGLPAVELADRCVESVFGTEVFELAQPHPIALADALERLLDDPALRERRVANGQPYLEGRTWERAAAQVEEGLRRALR